MKKFFKIAIKHPLISGSTVIFFGSMAANILNYVFNLGMLRFLSESDYGILISLISIFNIFSLFSITINTVFTKFSAMLVGQGKDNLIGTLFVSGSWWVGVLTLIVSGLIIVFSSQIAHFLNINSNILIIIIALSLLISFLSYVGNGILQGLLMFKYFSFINIFTSFVKLVFGLAFVFLGYKVIGAVSGFFLSVFVGYLLVFFPIARYLKSGRPNKLSIHSLHKKIYSYALPVFLSTIGVTLFIAIDIILVKHFFHPKIAGQYAAISIMCRSIFYAVSPIALVMFPLVAQKKERGENISKIVILAMSLVGIPAISLSIFYFLFPDLIRLIFAPNYNPKLINAYLGPFSIFIVLYTFSYLLNILYLSLGKIKVFIITILGALLEIVFIYSFHKDIGQVISGLILSSFLLLVGLLLYYPQATKQSKT